MIAKLLVVYLGLPAITAGAELNHRAAANPIRKVVTMLQMMQKKVEAEGAKETELFDKYMCYCKSSGGALAKSVADAKVKMPSVAADIDEAESKKVQLAEDVKQAQIDRDAAKSAIAEATGIREKDAAAFAAEKADSEVNLKAIAAAIVALEKGMSGSFLQSTSAASLRKIVVASQHLLDADRDDVLAFLSQKTGYAPQSGEIVGILKQMHETMSKALAEAIAAEKAANKGYEELMSAKTKEIDALTAAIEDKTVRIGEIGVQIVEMKEDLSDTELALMGDSKFLSDLEKNCATKEKEWAVVCKTRAEELSALADTIKLLNDDDALDLFKKTLPTPAASFLQMQVTASEVRSRALGFVRSIRQKRKAGRFQLDLISMALAGKKVSFDKVVKMIDEMVTLLKKEQVEDNHKKEYCTIQFDSLDDKKKGLERSISDLGAAISDAEGAIATLTTEIKALETGIVALDKAVAEATEQRKEEHADYKELMASDAAAKELLGLAKNRLNQFYNPKLHKPAPKRELSEEERITVNMGGTLAPTNAPGGIAGTGVEVFAQVAAHSQHRVAPPPPPEAVGAYQTKSEESTGVISMIDLLVKDLDKEMTEAEVTEKDAQADYEAMMKDSAEKRIADSKALEDKSATKADVEAKLLKLQEDQASTTKSLHATLKVIVQLHVECDWLLQYFDVRKEARADEIDSLLKAKAVLSGADYSLLQMTARSLRGHT